MEDLSRAISSCRICVEEPKGAPLPHEPRPVVRLSETARICIAGQAPGMRVHKSGKPFTDPSGDRLRQWMGIGEDVFYDQSRVAIVPMGFCFPGYDAKGGDRPPRKECAATWHDQIFTRMPQLQLILTIGQYAHHYHLGTNRKTTLTETVKNWRHYSSDTVRRYLPLPHPSWRNNGWLRKNSWFEQELIPVLQREVAALTLE